MDRFTVAGVLSELEKYFQMNNSTSGLLQTAFIVSYMLFAPLFGFIGDRYPRKWIIVGGVLFWSLVTLLSSFVSAGHLPLFFVFRSLVGVGEASYSTVAPTIIADLFSGKQRSNMIAVFYFAIPVGSGLGYIVGTLMMKWFGSWHWALRFTPFFGTVLAILYAFTTEPKRGQMDGVNYEQQNVSSPLENSSNKTCLTVVKEAFGSLLDDIKYLFKVPTYLLTTLGFTSVCFSTGALSWWAPYFMKYADESETEDR